METGTEWIKRDYKHSVCAQTCMCMCKLGDRNYITFTVAEGRWVGRESVLAAEKYKHWEFQAISRYTNSDLLHSVRECTCCLSLSLAQIHTRTHTQVGCGLWAAAASGPHFFVDVLLQLKLWLIGFLHGPVLQFPDTERHKDSYRIKQALKVVKVQ